jgi:hypothetical protein
MKFVKNNKILEDSNAEIGAEKNRPEIDGRGPSSSARVPGDRRILIPASSLFCFSSGFSCVPLRLSLRLCVSAGKPSPRLLRNLPSKEEAQCIS